MDFEGSQDKETTMGAAPLSPKTTKQEGHIIEASNLDKNRFSIWSTIGIQFAVAAAPVAVTGYSSLIPGAGGSTYFFWGYIVAIAGQLIIALSLAELASALPHASGQIYWAFALAPPRMSRFLSYFNGTWTVFGWIFATAASAIFAADFIIAFAMIVSPDYIPHSWHVYILAVAVICIGFILNTALIAIFPFITSFMIIFLFTALLVKTAAKASAQTTFVDVINETGWDSDGVVFLISLIPGLLTISLFDTAIHLAEEMPDPARQVPIVMLGNVLLSAVGGLTMVVALIFCTTHPENLLEPLGGQAILQICWDAWPSLGFCIATSVLFVANYMNGMTTIVTASSRVPWTFARAGGLPFKGWLSHVDHRLHVPLNAVLTVCIVTAVVDLLEFGPSTVLNGLFGAAGICFAMSYAMPIALLLIRGRGGLSNRRYLNLGGFGVPLNFIALG
ncbi:amino acid/polyamine transporter I [Hypoxylon trugodes]|uniref:amino acid/polyamine transporter I n=1 Tax=Hypoxylon trugodes TaxID=326681 RepID=UPI002194B1E0|nr:amino acid/polyamine transporter I [Hypoxylon trugodes]KAI1390870.1 amino acid/polyamine transporter I [Hypoxylon trugodes]